MSTKRGYLPPLIAMAWLLVACAPCMATTTNWRGVVIKVGEGRKENERSVTVRGTWGKIELDATHTIQVNVDRAHIFLDGRRATAQEAFKPGHLVKCLSDLRYYECYSRDFHLARATDRLDAGNGDYRLRLAKVVDLDFQSVRKGRAGSKRITKDLTVHLACRDGRITAVAVAGFEHGNNTIPSVPCDASGLRLADGRLTGELSYELLAKRGNGANGAEFPAPERGRLPCRVRLDVGLGTEAVTGTYSGTCGQQSVEGAVNGQGEDPVIVPEHYTVWLSLVTPTGNDDITAMRSTNCGISIRRTTEGLVAGPLYHLKGVSVGTAEPLELRLDGHQLSGVVRLAEHGSTQDLRFEGLRVGDAIFGSCELVGKDGEQALVGRFRGGLAAVDTPAFCGFGEGHREKQYLEEHPELPLSALEE